jgi:hypothetical protein
MVRERDPALLTAALNIGQLQRYGVHYPNPEKLASEATTFENAFVTDPCAAGRVWGTGTLRFERRPLPAGQPYDSADPALLQRLRGRLVALRGCSGTDCREVEDAH